MKDELFDELLESVKEGGKILRGEAPPAREHVFTAPDVRGIRERMGVSQSRFAQVLGISVATLRNWEQGLRAPEGPARVLLTVADRYPEVLQELNGADKGSPA